MTTHPFYNQVFWGNTDYRTKENRFYRTTLLLDSGKIITIRQELSSPNVFIEFYYD